MMKLDKTKSYAEVFGDAGFRYEQDGRKFDHHGNEVEHSVDPSPEPLPDDPSSDISTETPKKTRKKRR